MAMIRFLGMQGFGVARVWLTPNAEYQGSEEENQTFQPSPTLPGFGVLSGLQLC